jgi:hypothetical protein
VFASSSPELAVRQATRMAEAIAPVVLWVDEIDENWVELGDTGVLVNYTVVNYRDAHLPRKTPYILGMIQMDGAEATLVHLVEGVDPQNVKIGMRVKVVFAGKTTNTILDIDHFEPIEE